MPEPSTPIIADSAAFKTFGEAADAVLHFLNNRIEMGLWMVTRTVADDWTILHTRGTQYHVRAGVSLDWRDSYCSRMVAGLGPRIAPSSKRIPAYASAPINRSLDIGAYVGVPLCQTDGSLLGVLCGISPFAKPNIIRQEQPLIELCAGLLSTVLAREIAADQATRMAEVAQNEAMQDPLTGLFNRRGFDRLLAAEESRCARHGHAASIISIDLNGLKALNDTLGHCAGDDWIRRAGHMMRESCRSTDIIARVGGDEFLILAVETDSKAVATLLSNLRCAMSEIGISAAMGAASRRAQNGLSQTCLDADLAMYADKHSSRHAA